MGEVGDIEELLAALAQEDTRTQQMVAQPHHDLSQIHVLPDDMNFNLQGHPNLGMTDHLSATQIPHCAAGGLFLHSFT